MSKSTYIRELLVGRSASKMLMDAVLIYWHSSIPLADAKVFLDNFERKLKDVGHIR